MFSHVFTCFHSSWGKAWESSRTVTCVKQDVYWIIGSAMFLTLLHHLTPGVFVLPSFANWKEWWATNKGQQVSNQLTHTVTPHAHWSYLVISGHIWSHGSWVRPSQKLSSKRHQRPQLAGPCKEKSVVPWVPCHKLYNLYDGYATALLWYDWHCYEIYWNRRPLIKIRLAYARGWCHA